MKLPIWKLLLFGLVVFTGLTALSVFDTTLHPTISADLAVNQLNDTEAGAIAMRAYDRFQSFLPAGVSILTAFIGLCLVFGSALFFTDVIQLFTQEKK